MAWLDDIGLGQLADAISSYFARKTEAGGSLSWSGTNLTLNAVTGDSLGSVNLDSGLATDGQAAHTLSLENSSLVLKSVSGGTLSTVSLAALISGAVSDGVGSINYGRYLDINGKTLTLRDQHNNVLDSVTLP